MKQFDQVNRDLEVRDLYNLEDVFHMSKDYGGAYRARLHANLELFDRLDGWLAASPRWRPSPDRTAARRLPGGRPHTAVIGLQLPRDWAGDPPWEKLHNGRSLNDDAMDTLFTLLVNAGNGARVSDGVERPQTPVSDTFPYLAPPTPLPQGNLQANLAALGAPE